MINDQTIAIRLEVFPLHWGRNQAARAEPQLFQKSNFNSKNKKLPFLVNFLPIGIRNVIPNKESNVFSLSKSLCLYTRSLTRCNLLKLSKICQIVSEVKMHKCLGLVHYETQNANRFLLKCWFCIGIFVYLLNCPSNPIIVWRYVENLLHNKYARHEICLAFPSGKSNWSGLGTLFVRILFIWFGWTWSW